MPESKITPAEDDLDSGDPSSLTDLLQNAPDPTKSFSVVDEPDEKPKRKRKPKPIWLGSAPRMMVVVLAVMIAAVFAVGLGFVIYVVIPWTSPGNIVVTATPAPPALAAGTLPTPTAQFDTRQWNWGYPVYLKEKYSSFGEDIPVMIWATRFDGGEWLYRIFAENGASFEVPESFLALPPDTSTISPMITPSASTSGIPLGSVKWAVTTEQVGSIPAFTRVEIGSVSYNGVTYTYSIKTAGGNFSEAALEWQLAYDPVATPTPATN